MLQISSFTNVLCTTACIRSAILYDRPDARIELVNRQTFTQTVVEPVEGGLKPDYSLRAGLDSIEEREITRPCWESNQGYLCRLVSSLVALLL
jgi:hypothetical protein